MTIYTKKMIRNKKASFFDVLGIIVGSAILIILVIAIYIALAQTSQGLEDVKDDIPLNSFNDSADIIVDQSNKYPAFWDFLIAFCIFALWLAAFISAYILGSNPIFLTIYIVMSIAGLVVGAVMEFALEEVITNAVLTSFTASYPISLFIVNNFLAFTIFFIVSMAIGLYLKPGEG